MKAVEAGRVVLTKAVNGPPRCAVPLIVSSGFLSAFEGSALRSTSRSLGSSEEEVASISRAMEGGILADLDACARFCPECGVRGQVSVSVCSSSRGTCDRADMRAKLFRGVVDILPELSRAASPLSSSTMRTGIAT